MSESSENKVSVDEREMNDSRFYMWRAIFALAHADDKITLEERQFMADILSREPFDDVQKAILTGDIKHKQDIGEMFAKVTDQTDRSAFFYFARLLCWCDGDFAEQEQAIILKLKETHLKELNFEQMIGTVTMELDEEERQWLEEDAKAVKEGSINSFMSAFVARYNTRKRG